MATATARSLEQWSPRLLVLGSAIWLVSWVLNAQTADGSMAVLGLSERGWRRLLDPGTLFLMGGLLGFHIRKRQSYGKLGLAGYVTTQVGLAVVLIGNAIEFWIGEWLYVDRPGEFEPTDHIGWAVFLLGIVLTLVGSLLLGVALLKRSSSTRGTSAA